VNWFSRQLYRLLKIITKTVLWIYYPKTSVLNRKRLKFDQPTIIACSHPNTMMDPLHVASRTKNPVFFLANADLFASKFGNWFYSNFFCIPIKRRTDEKGKHIKNEDSFNRVIEFLKNGGCLWVAPEGGSYWGRHWMKLKTGTARMGLMTEVAHDFQANVQILPVGLNYEAPNLFRTSLVINVGEGIQVKDYRVDHEESPRKAIYQLTKDLEERLQALEISPADEEEDYFLSRLEKMLKNEFPISTKAAFTRTEKLLENLQNSDNQMLRDQIDDYFDLLKKYKLSDRAVMRFAKLPLLLKILDLVWIVLGFPLFLYGVLNNLLASYLPYYITNSRQPYIGYRATVKMVIGLITFPLFYTLQTIFIHLYFQNTWITAFYLLSLIPTGLFAWHYAQWMRLVLKRGRVHRLAEKVQREILGLREAILKEVKPIN